MSNKVTPCVTVMICVAGCSSTTSQDLPHTRNFPAPQFDLSKPSSAPVETRRHERSLAELLETPNANIANKPSTVELPVDVFKDIPPPAPVFSAKFETVPDGFLKGASGEKKSPEVKPFFTPLRPQAPAPPKPAQTAEAILEPLIKVNPPKTVMLPEPIAYAEYVSVGPEYFGLGSEIAPYVISRSPTAPPPKENYVITTPVAILPKTFVAEADIPNVDEQPTSPLPRLRPSRQIPDPQPLPDTEFAAVIPPRPLPDPRRAPAEPAPRIPIRIAAERPAVLQPREDTLEGIERKRETRVRNEPPKSSGWSSAAEKALRGLKAPRDEQPDTRVYRVTIAPPVERETKISSLSPSIELVDTAPPDLSKVTSDDLAANSAVTPPPKKKPTPRPEGIQVAGSLSGVKTRTPRTIQTPPANDRATASNCFVNKGSNDRMILICEGVDVSKTEVFRAVVEGESAFRGLRTFDSTQDVVAIYGFNAERFNAMSQGPRSARDLAFLRALRKSGKKIRVKGRSFDLYLMKGDIRLATVLIEQVSEVEMPASIRYN